jgi:hypothetical protein
MSIYPELPSNTTRNIDGIAYHVRKYGIGSKVYEEELMPIPTQKTVNILNVDGTINEEKSYVEDIIIEESSIEKK